MQQRIIKSEGFLLLTAAIWGFAFVAQRTGMQYVGPFTFNAIRFAMGSLILVPVIIIRSQKRTTEDRKPTISRYKSMFWMVSSGFILFGGASLQQTGIVYTSAGKAGFITGLYVIIVPIIGIFFGHKSGPGTWIGAGSAIAGLYFLSINEQFALSKGDGFVLISAVFWASHVVLISKFSKLIDSFLLASIQFAVVSLLSFSCALIMEPISTDEIFQATIPLLYAGMISTGIAYTLQVIAQKNIPPSHAAIIMSLESVFALIGGTLILDETISLRAAFGCCLMLSGMIISQKQIQ